VACARARGWLAPAGAATASRHARLWVSEDCFESIRLVDDLTRPDAVRGTNDNRFAHQSNNHLGKADQKATFPRTPQVMRLSELFFVHPHERVRVFLAFNLRKHGSRSPPQVVPPVSLSPGIGPVLRDRMLWENVVIT
jgi:hypothetical protein